MPSKKIGDLSVADLKAELAKRSGDISGNKASLLERLRGLLEGEGLDPDNMDFDETAEGKQEVTLQSLASLMGGMKESMKKKKKKWIVPLLFSPLTKHQQKWRKLNQLGGSVIFCCN
uniref:Scaffold attachment factor B1 n=1 Tax=Cacopsylla melanoneura TaxID=428564 RepID=A0A8D8ZGL2_9HEMI